MKQLKVLQVVKEYTYMSKKCQERIFTQEEQANSIHPTLHVRHQPRFQINVWLVLMMFSLVHITPYHYVLRVICTDIFWQIICQAYQKIFLYKYKLTCRTCMMELLHFSLDQFVLYLMRPNRPKQMDRHIWTSGVASKVSQPESIGFLSMGTLKIFSVCGSN